MKQVGMRGMYMLVLVGGLVANMYAQEVTPFTAEECAVEGGDQSAEGPDITFQTLNGYLENGEYGEVAKLCEQAYADPISFNHWAILYGFLGHAQVMLGQPDVGLGKIEKVIEHPEVSPRYRGWACRMMAYWMQSWECNDRAEEYRQQAVQFGYTD